MTAQLGRAALRGDRALRRFGRSVADPLLISTHLPRRLSWLLLFQQLAVDYSILFLVQCVSSPGYHRAQKVEISSLRADTPAFHPQFAHHHHFHLPGEADSARDLLSKFSSYLRGLYDYDSGEMIAIGRTGACARLCALEQARFGERVRVEYDIESERLLLPPLSLQPLVENAFIHGLREKPGGGTVTIYAKRTDKGKALVGVRDDGLGLRAKAPATRDGVGIENINRRLSRLYRTQLVFAQPAGGGCDVSMEIPWKEADKNARIHR